MNDMNTVTISVQSFEGLVRDSEKLEFLKNLIIGSIALSYNGRDLRINDDDKILDAIRLIDESALMQKERYLREERKKEEEDEK